MNRFIDTLHVVAGYLMLFAFVWMCFALTGGV